MSVQIGGRQATGLRLGSRSVSKAYLGGTRVFPTVESAPFEVVATGTLQWRIQGTAVTIDFGDGTVTTADYENVSIMTHTFPDDGNYIVKFSGGIRRLRFGGGAFNVVPNPSVLEVRGVFPGSTAEYAFDGCTKLTSIPAGLFINAGDGWGFQGAFRGCTGLTSIPPGLFDKCTAVEDFAAAFQGCTGLTSIPPELFDKCTSATHFGAVFFGFGTFWGCTGLTSIPPGLFDKCTAVEDFTSTFYECTGLTGAAPELWTRENVTYGGMCFYNCTGLSNYDDIPEDWK